MSFSGDMIAVYLCYLTGALVVAVSLLQIWGSLFSRYPTEKIAKTNHGVPVHLALHTDGQTVVVEGFLDFKTNTRLQKTLQQNPQLKTLLLSSEGGRVLAARAGDNGDARRSLYPSRKRLFFRLHVGFF